MTKTATPLPSTRVDGVPRRMCRMAMSDSEKAIFNCIQLVEGLGADPLLTDAVVGLGAIRDKVADWLEGKTGLDSVSLGATKAEATAGSWWLIEIQGPSYLTVKNLGGYKFQWTNDVNQAIRFADMEQADVTMMAIRNLCPDLFPLCLPRPAHPVHHIWIPETVLVSEEFAVGDCQE